MGIGLAGRLQLRASFALTILVATLGPVGANADAASPAWKLLAVTGPTNLSPRQSEVQRLTIEAEGGTFTLTSPGSNGEGTPVVAEAHLDLVKGSPVATIEGITGGGMIEPGDRVAVPEEPGEATIVSCSSDCRSPGSTLELSEDATATESGAPRSIYTKELSDVSGSFFVGDEIAGSANGSQYLEPGTVVRAVGPGTLTLSKPTHLGYTPAEGALELSSKPETTAPVAFDAESWALEEALLALPRFAPGSLSVEGGSGGDGEHPYLIKFDGPGAAEREIEELEADPSGLLGPTANANVFTIVPGGPGTGEIVVMPVNIGGAGSRGSVTLKIGPLPDDVRAAGTAVGEGWGCSGGTAETAIVCTSFATVAALSPAGPVRLPVKVDQPLTSSSFVPVEISGGSAGTASYPLPIEVSSTPAPLGTRAFWAGAFDADGDQETQAGAHPFSAQTFFVLNTVRSASGGIIPAGVLENFDADLPAGFIGNPMATPRCPQGQLVAGEGEELPLCNGEMKLGMFAPIVEDLAGGSEKLLSPIYNDVPPNGSAAEFSALLIKPTQSLLGSLRSDEDLGVRVTAPNIPNIYKAFGAYAALEGDPAGAHGQAFLTAPTDCAEEAQNPPMSNLRLEAYELPGVVSATSVPISPVTGCDKLHFTPSLAFSPSSTQGSSPTGAVADLHVPQEGLTDPDQLAQPDLKKAVVSLPDGLVLNPSAANGLAPCSEAQMGYVGTGAMPNPTRFDEAPVTCPDASKIGTFSIKTPLLDEEGKLEGTIYLAAQEDNPFHSLIAVYLVVESERFGVTLKLPGKVEPDQRTGRLTATFDNNPQVPFEDLILHFRGGGPRSIFATPEVCGHYSTTGSLEPWSAPESGPPAPIDESSFTLSGGCSGSAAARPFGPTLEAGTTGTRAGAYSPLVIKVARKDGEGELGSLDFTLPQGLLGKLAGIPYCPDASIKAAAGKSGKAEQASPSCPAASRIGSVDAAGGVGTEPFHVGGQAYLAGPYKGAPLSAVAIVPAVAGPFDLGDVVIRAPLFVDPETAQISAKSDPVPTILRGIPLKVRSVAIDLDRPGFTHNPTSCNPMTLTASVGSTDGATAKPVDRFQVGGCDKLRFRPRLRLSLLGAPGRRGHPGVRATMSDVAGEATPVSVGVSLPPGELLDLRQIRGLCPRNVSPDRCPPSSRLGSVRIESSFLPEPLTGALYLRVPGHRLPGLVAALHSGSLEFTLHGRITDSQGNLGVRLESLPDVPLSSADFTVAGGRLGIVVNSRSLCGKKHHVRAILDAHDGARRRLRVAVRVGGCR